MKKSKKGLTLIELITALLVLLAAILAGTQLFSAAAKGYSNSRELSTAAESLASAFETGRAFDALPPNINASESAVNVKITLPGGQSFTDSARLVELVYSRGTVRARLFGLKNSYGGGS